MQALRLKTSRQVPWDRNTPMKKFQSFLVIKFRSCPSNLPIFLLYNTVMSSPVTDLNTCCILGYHGTTGFPIQTYSPGEFDTTGLFGSTVSDTSIFAHEIDEWMDDPFGNNPTPAWGEPGR